MKPRDSVPSGLRQAAMGIFDSPGPSNQRLAGPGLCLNSTSVH